MDKPLKCLSQRCVLLQSISVQDRQHRSLLSRKQFYHNYLLPSRVLHSKAIRKHVLLHWSWAHFYIIRNMQCTHAGTLLRDHIIRYQPCNNDVGETLWSWTLLSGAVLTGTLDSPPNENQLILSHLIIIGSRMKLTILTQVRTRLLRINFFNFKILRTGSIPWDNQNPVLMVIGTFACQWTGMGANHQICKF